MENDKECSGWEDGDRVRLTKCDWVGKSDLSRSDAFAWAQISWQSEEAAGSSLGQTDSAGSRESSGNCTPSQLGMWVL